MKSTQQNTRVARRRLDIARRYLQGERQAEIAADFQISQAQISVDLRAIRQAWLESSVRDFDAAKAEELARLDLIEAESWASWNKSKEQQETTIQEKTEGKLKVSRRLAGQTGDPRYLEMVLKCVDRRCKILGLDAPTRFTIDWDSLTDVQMEQLARGEPLTAVLAAPPDGMLPAAPSPIAEA